MKIQRIYIDTSVIGGCFDDEFRRWSNGLFKNFSDKLFYPVVSELVSAEVDMAPEPIRGKYAELLDLGAEVIRVSESAVELQNHYFERGVLGTTHQNDMLHIALATVARADMVVSWNFKHIVHYDKIRLFNAVNIQMGYQQIEIYSPRQVTTDE